jgi:hypothetical protein
MPAEPAMTAKPKLRWYQLSLSTVLAATTAIAIEFGMRSNENVALFVTELAASIAVFVVCEGWMEWRRLREESWQPEFWRSFEKAEAEFREANRLVPPSPQLVGAVPHPPSREL